jgi:hypothetical protein
MDAYVQVALIEKSKRIFATDAGIFLSFPLLSPLTFTPQALAALSTPASAADYASAADFARIVNFLPRDMVASGSSDRYLWDIYADVLARADVADDSAGQAGQGSDGSALLYEVAPDGMRTESAIYRAYRQYRDAWIVAREDYGARKLTGELADNPDARRHWTDVEEPALRATLAKAEADWKTLGHRDEVEAALQAERDAALNDPRTRWRDWANAFNPDIDLLDNVSGGRYAPTGLSPKDFAGDAAWLHFEPSAIEMASLIRDAPAALKVVLDDNGASGIDHVSFDYRSVAIVRPWFHSNVLTSRIWRSNDPGLALSDGGDPPSGICPAYVTAVVFVRNLQVTSRAVPATTPVTSNLRFTLAANRLTQRDLQPMLLRQVAQPPETVAAPVTVQRAFSRLDSQTLIVARTVAAQPSVQHVAFRPAVAMQLNPMIRTLDVNTQLHTPLRTVPGPVSPPSPAPQPTQPPSQPTQSPERHDDIAILAFICKRLPKVPDPMPDLRWN